MTFPNNSHSSQSGTFPRRGVGTSTGLKASSTDCLSASAIKRLGVLGALSIYLSTSLSICSCTPSFAQDAAETLPSVNSPDKPEKSGTADATTNSPSINSSTGVNPSAASSSTSGSGDNLTVEDIKIEGNRLVPTEDILGVVKTRRGDKFDRDQIVQDLKAINSMGYFDDRSLQVLPEQTNGGVLLKIRVQENAPVTQFCFQGNNVLSSEEISKLFSNQLGKPQNLNTLSAAIDKVEQAYHEKGFVLARITDVKDDPDGSIGLTIKEGEIENVEIAGNRKTKDFIIKSAIKLKPGSVYNERQLTNDLRKLYANGYFQDIRRSLQPSPTNPDKYVLKVEVDERRTGSIGLGGGVDSVAGPFGSMSFSDNNFRGRGQILSFNSQVGSGMFGQGVNAINNAGTNFLSNQRTYQIEATFVEPNLKGTDTSMAVSGFGRNFSSLLIDQAQQRTLGASVTFTKPLKRNFNLNLGFVGENTSLRDFSTLLNTENTLTSMANRALDRGLATNMAGAEALASQVRNQQLKGGTYLSVNPSLQYDTRDAMFDTTKGTHAKLSAGPALGLSGASFAKLGASVSKFIPVTKDVTFASNMQAGTAFGGMPQFAQYRLGGWNGIRGYRMFSDLGTGTSMLMGSAELRARLPFAKHSNSGFVRAIDKHVKVALFSDVGQVSGNTLTNNLFGRSALGASVGVGLRVNVPMLGLIRFEYGLPLVSTLLGGMTPRFTIGFGEKF